MAGESFDEKKILSIENLIENLRRKTDRETENLHRVIEKTHRNIDRETETTGSEILRREENEKAYSKAFSEIEKPTTRQIFSVLRVGGGRHRFTDIHRFVVCSSSTLTNALRELIERGLVRRKGGLYQAVSPAWFAQEKLEQKE